MRWRDVLFQSKHFNQLSFLLTATVCLHVLYILQNISSYK